MNQDYTGNEMRGYEMEFFVVNMKGCRYRVTPCARMTGAECVIHSEAGVLVTAAHSLSNPFILPVESEYVLVEAIQ